MLQIVCDALAVPETLQLPFAVFASTGQQGGSVVDALLDVGGVFLMTTDDAGGGTEGEIRRGRTMASTPICST